MKPQDHRPLPEFSDMFIDRFWRYALRDGPGGCWPWRGKLDQYGAISVGVKHGGPLVATRVAYKLHYGKDPGELLVCHSCDHPGCVNPGHLFLGTALDNVRDAMEKGRMAFLSTHSTQRCSPNCKCKKHRARVHYTQFYKAIKALQ